MSAVHECGLCRQPTRSQGNLCPPCQSEDDRIYQANEERRR